MVAVYADHTPAVEGLEAVLQAGDNLGGHDEAGGGAVVPDSVFVEDAVDELVVEVARGALEEEADVCRAQAVSCQETKKEVLVLPVPKGPCTVRKLAQCLLRDLLYVCVCQSVRFTLPLPLSFALLFS